MLYFRKRKYTQKSTDYLSKIAVTIERVRIKTDSKNPLRQNETIAVRGYEYLMIQEQLTRNAPVLCLIGFVDTKPDFSDYSK